MLEVDVKDQSNDYAVLRAPGKSDLSGGPYALVPKVELKETTEAFSKSHISSWNVGARGRTGFSRAS